MRRSRGTKFLVEDGVFFGITLEADFTSEHEWGIEGISHAFGINSKDESRMGIERYTMTSLSNNLTFLKKGKRKIQEAILHFNDCRSLIEELKERDYPNKDDLAWKELNSWKDPEEATSAWDERSFAVRGFTPEEISRMEEIYNAFLSNDLAIWVGGRGPFGGGGMHLIIVSKFPDQHKQQLWLDHSESKRLQEAVDKIGIVEELAAAGKKYYALKPAFFKDEDESEVVRFFLNPQEQDRNEFGWFSADELRQWIDGKGPIPKVKEGVKQ